MARSEGLPPGATEGAPGIGFSGWRIVGLSAVVMGMTAGAQSPGVSVFVDPMIETLQLSRSQVSGAYLVGTLTGSLALPRIGRVIDDRGTRFAMVLVGGIFGVLLAAMAGVTGLLTLTLGFVGIRMFGQGALGLVATTAPAPWFKRRRGLAIGVTTAVGSGLISLMPVLIRGVLIPGLGWRSTWLVLALVVWVVVLPIALWGIVNRPSDIGQQPDGDVALDAESSRLAELAAGAASFTRAEALRTPMFWAIAGGVAATGMIGTGMVFHQIDLLGEQGLTPVEAAANFIPQTIAALASTVLVGSMVDRFPIRWVLTVSMLLLAVSMVMVPTVTPGLVSVIYGAAVGAGGASARALEAAAFPKMFGLGHIGAIRGVVSLIGVASTAFGPLALSIGRDLTGNYIQVLLLLLVIPAGVAALGLFAKVPARPQR